MCTERQFDDIYKVLKKEKQITIEPLEKTFFHNIADNDIMDAFDRLKSLGFARSINYLDGGKAVEITNQGRKMYHAIY